MKVIDKVALIYVKDGKILSSRSKGKDKYYLPGGKRENDETDLETLTREIKEELSVDIIKESVKPYGIFTAQAHGKEENVLVQMTCLQADFSGILMPANEIEEIVWLTFEDRFKSSPVDILIFEDLRNKGLL